MSRRTAQRKTRKIVAFREVHHRRKREADELAKTGVILDEGFMAEARAKTVQQEREEEVFAALQYAASFHCLVEEWKNCEELKPKPKAKWIFVDKKREGAKHRTEWCVEANEEVVSF